jgi:hypothetical protein
MNFKAFHESLVRVEDHQLISERKDDARHSEIIGLLLTLKNDLKEHNERLAKTENRIFELERRRPR